MSESLKVMAAFKRVDDYRLNEWFMGIAEKAETLKMELESQQ